MTNLTQHTDEESGKLMKTCAWILWAHNTEANGDQSFIGTCHTDEYDSEPTYKIFSEVTTPDWHRLYQINTNPQFAGALTYLGCGKVFNIPAAAGLSHFINGSAEAEGFEKNLPEFIKA